MKSIMLSGRIEMLFEFYLDGKELFVCLASGSLGCLTSYFYFDWSINRNLNSLFRMILLLSSLILDISKNCQSLLVSNLEATNASIGN